MQADNGLILHKNRTKKNDLKSVVTQPSKSPAYPLSQFQELTHYLQ